MTALALHPLDLPVALRILDAPGRTFAALAHDLGLSASTVHASVHRLLQARLLRRGLDTERAVSRHALLEFAVHGARYAFPGILGADILGVPTAHGGPVLSRTITQVDIPVWPSAAGTMRGPALAPLLPKAELLPTTDPALYALLTAVDALRVGRARERNLATAYLTRRIGDGEPFTGAEAAA